MPSSIEGDFGSDSLIPRKEDVSIPSVSFKCAFLTTACPLATSTRRWHCSQQTNLKSAQAFQFVQPRMFTDQEVQGKWQRIACWARRNDHPCTRDVDTHESSSAPPWEGREHNHAYSSMGSARITSCQVCHEAAFAQSAYIKDESSALCTLHRKRILSSSRDGRLRRNLDCSCSLVFQKTETGWRIRVNTMEQSAPDCCATTELTRGWA